MPYRRQDGACLAIGYESKASRKCSLDVDDSHLVPDERALVEVLVLEAHCVGREYDLEWLQPVGHAHGHDGGGAQHVQRDGLDLVRRGVIVTFLGLRASKAMLSFYASLSPESDVG